MAGSGAATGAAAAALAAQHKGGNAALMDVDEGEGEEGRAVLVGERPAPAHLKRLLAAQNTLMMKSGPTRQVQTQQTPQGPPRWQAPGPSAAGAGACGRTSNNLAHQDPPSLALPTPAATAHQLLLLVVHAAMLEAGFVLDTRAGTAGDTGDANTATAASGSTPAATGKQAAAAAAAPPQLSGPSPTVLTYQWPTLTPTPTTTQSAPSDAPLPPCTVTAVRMGRFLVLHAAVGACPGAPAAAATPSTAALPRPQGVRTVHVDAVAEVDASVVEAGGGRVSVGAFNGLGPLWVRLRDGVAQWAVAACHTAAGLDPPQGLLALPMELMLGVLGCLPVRLGGGAGRVWFVGRWGVPEGGGVRGPRTKVEGGWE